MPEEASRRLCSRLPGGGKTGEPITPLSMPVFPRIRHDLYSSRLTHSRRVHWPVRRASLLRMFIVRQRVVER